MHKLVQQAYNMSLVLGILFLDFQQDVDLGLRLQHERLARLDDLDRHFAFVFLVIRAHHLSKRSLQTQQQRQRQYQVIALVAHVTAVTAYLPHAVLQNVSVLQDLVSLKNVVVMLVIEAVVVDTPA